MPARFYETRKSHLNSPRTWAHDLAAHLEARQHAEKAVVICDNPASVISSVRKHWFRLTRGVQKQRSSTINADKILRYTHAISHMQFMGFSVKMPTTDPDAQVYFMKPADYLELPLNCYTLYLLDVPSRPGLEACINELPEFSLVVDLTGDAALADLGLQPKSKLERNVRIAWEALDSFFTARDVDIERLTAHDLSLFDSALDNILGSYHEFLRLAAHLQRCIDLAQPVSFTHTQKRQFEMCSMLAYRIQTLTISTTGSSLALDFLNDHTFFLHDPNAEAHRQLGLSASQRLGYLVRPFNPSYNNLLSTPVTLPAAYATALADQSPAPSA